MVGLGSLIHADRMRPRRLFYEAYTTVGAEMKRKVEAGSDEAPRTVPNAEREARRTSAAKRLSGIKFRGELDISDRLID